LSKGEISTPSSPPSPSTTKFAGKHCESDELSAKNRVGFVILAEFGGIGGQAKGRRMKSILIPVVFAKSPSFPLLQREKYFVEVRHQLCPAKPCRFSRFNKGGTYG